MKKLAIVFPGQGSQKIGMGQDLYQNYVSVKELFLKAEAILKKDIAKICFEGPEDILSQTENTQASIFLVSASIFTILRGRGVEASFFAGHSLGEITAYWAAGVFDLTTAFNILKIRGQAMASSYPSGKSMMAAVLGAKIEDIESVIANVTKPSAPVVIANYNSPEQVVISGERTSVEIVCEKLKAARIRKIIPLNVSGGFHSPLMNNASENFKNQVAGFNFSDAKVPIVLNRTAESEIAGVKLKENLPRQINSSVRWFQSINYLNDKVDGYIECGPGKVLTDLIKKCSEKPCESINDLSSLQNFLNVGVNLEVSLNK